MLVLTRRIGEELVIDGEIVVKIISARGNQVRIGIAAPRSIRVVRKECVPESKQGLCLAGQHTEELGY